MFIHVPLLLLWNKVKFCFSRYDSEFRSARPERDYPAVRDYPSGRARDYPVGGDRDYGPPPRERDYPGYYSPPRDYPPGDRDYLPPRGRDYPPGGRDYQLARDDFDMASRRYNSRYCILLSFLEISVCGIIFFRRKFSIALLFYSFHTHKLWQKVIKHLLSGAIYSCDILLQ